MQVWASSAAEGRRVIDHACAHAGIDPADPDGTFSAVEVHHPRFQRVSTWRVAERDGVPLVTSRSGPEGPPTLADGSGFSGLP
jgi:hypothetical protein